MASESPLFQYFEAVRGRMLSLKAPGETTWRDAVERGIAEAHQSGDQLGLVQVVQTLCGLLEGDGNLAAAVDEIEFARSFCVGHPGADAWLQIMKAGLLASQARAAEALAVAGPAAEIARGHLEGIPRAKALAVAETVRMIALGPPSDTLDRFIQELMAAKRPLEQLHITIWHIPFLASRGVGREARPLVRTAAALAGAQESLFHGADVVVFGRWLEVIAGATQGGEDKKTYFNPTANLRSAYLDAWQALRRRDWAAAEIAIGAIERRTNRTGAVWGPPGNWKALLRAMHTGEAPETANVSPPAPANLTLATLGGAVAGAYAVALAGTRPHAEEWLDWVARTRKRGIESCMEVPVALRRVEGLLALRAGRIGMAGKLLAAAGREALRHGYGVESALATLQYEELRTRQNFEPTAAMAQARTRLTECALDPVPHMYAVHHAIGAGTVRPALVLTPREREVLRHLGQGLTYRETAEQLGTAWKTVQTQAHRAYEKLSASNKTEAVAEARRLGLL